MGGDTMQRALRRAERLMKQQEYQAVELLLQPVVERRPTFACGRAAQLCADAIYYRILREGGDLRRVERLLAVAMSGPGLPRIAYAHCLNRLGTIAYARDRFQEAIAIYREARALLPLRAGTRTLHIRLGGNLAEALRSSDEPEAAHMEYLWVMEHLEDRDDWYMQGALYLGMAANHHDRRQDHQAIQRALRAQACFNRCGDPFLAPRASLLLGYYFLAHELPVQATQTINASLSLAKASGDPTLKFLVRYDLALVRFHCQEYTETERLGQAAYQAARDSGHPRFMAQCATLLAETSQALGDETQALARWLEAGQMCEQLNLPLRAGQIWQRLGMLLSARGDTRTSRQYMQRARHCLHGRLPDDRIASSRYSFGA